MRRQRLRGRWGTAVIGLVFTLLLSGCVGGGSGGSPAPAPKLAVDKTSLDFGERSSTLSLRISNAGGGRLTWSVSSDREWVHAVPAEGENAATVTVFVDRSALEPGQHAGALTIASNGGTATVAVLVTVPESGGAAPGRVQDVDARGFTLPASVVAASIDASSASLQARRLLELAAAFDAAAQTVAASPAAASVTQAKMPAGYQGVFALSWRAEPAATGYRIFFDTGAGWQQVDVSVADLEDPSQPTFLVAGNFDVGTQAVFAVQAFNGDLFGDVSDEDGAVIIAPQFLSQPANGHKAPRRPTFMWQQHPSATAYFLYLTAGGFADHLWTQVVGNEVLSVQYPGDAANVSQELAPGQYAWFVAAQGPVDAAHRADAYAVSALWTFTVE
nr:hypothetical protein [Bacillota bacterium]